MIYELSTKAFSSDVQDCIKNISHGNNACILKDDGDQAFGALVNMQQFNILKRIEQNFQKVNDVFKEIGKNMTEEEVENFASEAVKYAREHA
jgi:hypothetical protein